MEMEQCKNLNSNLNFQLKDTIMYWYKCLKNL